MTDRATTDQAAARPGPVPAALPPGSCIGILGGGQLGRMLAMAAAELGLKTHIYSDVSGPAFDVATGATEAAYEDAAALEAFAGQVQAVTYEFENVPLEALRRLQPLVPLRPGIRALEVAQDRLSEKTFLQDLDIGVAPFHAIDRAVDIDPALDALQAPAILKTRRLGYDGKGQLSLIPGDDDGGAAFKAIGARPAVLEQRLDFGFEFSVLVVRGLDGAIDYYDCPQNTHSDGILRLSRVPSPLSASDAREAKAIAGRIAEALDYVGVLAVEFFHLGEGRESRLLVNEFAPRVHNSGHWTSDACSVSQFENHIRAVAGWPLGTTARHSDAEMSNLIGPEANDWRQLSAEPGACLHLYGKHVAREGRKMGHVTRLKPKT